MHGKVENPFSLGCISSLYFGSSLVRGSKVCRTIQNEVPEIGGIFVSLVTSTNRVCVGLNLNLSAFS